MLAADGDASLIESHADQYMTLLVKSQNWREAIELYEDTLARSPDWTMREVGNIVPLAQAALRSGNPKIAGRLVRAFDRKHPNHPDVPRAYLLGAQLMAELRQQARGSQAHPAVPGQAPRRRSGRRGSASGYLEVMRRMAK